MAISNLRKNDEKCSEIISEFLDLNFYNETINSVRNDNFAEQIIGIDTKFSLNGFDYICDEKAAVQYINKRLGTFALELSFINRCDNETVGWFLNEKCVNNSYLFVWIDKTMSNGLLYVNDIIDLEIALVRKDKIIEYLESIGWTKDKLKIKCDRIRKFDNEYLGNMYETNCKFTFSKQLVEKPINILMKRSKLKELSDFTQQYINI